MALKWEPHKEGIKELFMDQRLSVDEVMKVMEERGFRASKRTYERKIKEWGFEKNFKYLELTIVKARHNNLVKGKVEFEIHFRGNRLDGSQLKKLDGCLIPRSQKYRLERSKLPEKWAIIPCVSKAYLRSVTTKLLPFEVFQHQFDSFVNAGGFLDMPLQMRELVLPTLRRRDNSLLCKHHSQLIENIFHNLSAVMPVEEDEEICSLLWQIIGEDSSSATAQFLKLAIYFLSNKLFEDNQEVYCQVNDELLKWFRMGNNHVLLRDILSSRTPTIDALAEGLFASALRAEDLSSSMIFLEAGLSPDMILDHREYESSTHAYGYSALEVMIEKSNTCLVELLLGFGANANVTARSTLALAARHGNLEIARLLISSEAPVNCWEERKRAWQTPLQAALRAGDVEMVRFLLDRGADVNFPRERIEISDKSSLYCAFKSGVPILVDMLLGYDAKLNPGEARRIGTPLQRAIQGGNETETGRLLELGTDVNTPAGDFDGRTALQGAAEKGDLALCQVLIQAGADVNAIHARDSFDDRYGANWTEGVTALVAAVHSRNHQLVKFLVDRGADVNTPISKQAYPAKRTALTLATSFDDVEMVQYLVDSGADAGRDDSILFATGKRRAELIPLLIAAGANINHQDEHGCDLLYKTVEGEELDFVRLLLDCGARPGSNSLPRAAAKGNVRTVQLLTEAGANINSFGIVGFQRHTPRRMHALQAAALRGHVEMVTFLLDRGADVNWPGSDGGTALQAAVRYGDVGLIQLLIAREADVNAAAKYGKTALQEAVRQNNRPLVYLLLETGANADDEPSHNWGYSSLQHAAIVGADDLIHILLDHGASINGPISFFGLTALQAAVRGGHFRTVQLLLEKGAYVNASGSRRGTALQNAASKGYLRIAKALIDAKADINASGRRTALESAALSGRIDMLKLLLNAGANITTTDGRRQLRNALRYATESGHNAAAKFLECHQISMGA